MQTETIDISSLTADPANVRKHGERNLETIKASLKRFGQQKPIVVSADGVVVAGNGTLEAARALGWTAIDVVRTPLSGPEATAYAIADNRTAELAEWNDDALAQALVALRVEDEELVRMAGFDDDDIASLTDMASVDFSTPPDSVQENIDHVNEIKAQRRRGNENTANKNDTEHYLVIVFPDRSEKEKTLNKLGLPSDERYIAASQITLLSRVGTKPVVSHREAKSATPDKSGAGG